MKKINTIKEFALNFEALENISGGTGPLGYPYKSNQTLDYPYNSCDPPMKETGPLGYPYKSNQTLDYPYNSCDPPMKETGPLNYPYKSNQTGPLGVRV